MILLWFCIFWGISGTFCGCMTSSVIRNFKISKIWWNHWLPRPNKRIPWKFQTEIAISGEVMTDFVYFGRLGPIWGSMSSSVVRNFKISRVKYHHRITGPNYVLPENFSLKCAFLGIFHIWGIHLYIYTFIHLYIYTFIHLYIYTFIHLYIYTFIHLYIYTFIHLYIYTFIHLYIYTFIHLYIYTFIHLYIYTVYTVLQLYSLYSLYSYTVIQLYSYTVIQFIQLYSYTVIHLYIYTVIQLYSYTVIQLDS